MLYLNWVSEMSAYIKRNIAESWFNCGIVELPNCGIAELRNCEYL